MGAGASKQEAPLIILAYAPEKSNHFTYCGTHAVYTNDVARVESLPPPHPPPSRKREIFNPKNYDDVDKRTRKLYVDLHKPITELVHQLISCYDDEIAKVRALYMWITSQPVETSTYSKSNATSTMYQLWHLQNKHTNYADFFSILCWFAGIPCVIIRGYLKGSTYEVGEKMSHDRHEGDWNAVLIGGHWRFIDVFWGSCIVVNNEDDMKGKFVYQADGSFFLIDPEVLIYSHFPDEPAWQMLKEEKSLEQFESQAVVKERFFSFNMELLTHTDSKIEAVDGKVAIHFTLHPAKSLKQSFVCIPSYMSDVQDRQRWKNILVPRENIVLLVKQNGSRKELTVNVKFPVPGVYKLDILGKRTDKQFPGYDFDWVAVYKVVVNSVPDEANVPKPLPQLTAEGYGPGENLKHLGLQAISYQKGVIHTIPGSLELRLQIIDTDKFNNAHVVAKLLQFRHNYNIPIASSEFELQGKTLQSVIHLKEGVYRLAITYRVGEDKELNIINYHVLCVPLPTKYKPGERGGEKQETEGLATPEDATGTAQKANVTTAKDDIEMLRKRLEAAIAGEEVAALEMAVHDTEQSAYIRALHLELKEAKRLLVKLLRLRKAVADVMKLDQRSIAEIKSYSHPIPAIHRVMKAVMCLLGHPEHETKEWKKVQSLIGRTGKQSLKRRIKELDINTLDPACVEGSRALLSGIELNTIVTYSVGVAAFFSWTMEVADLSKPINRGVKDKNIDQQNTCLTLANVED